MHRSSRSSRKVSFLDTYMLSDSHKKILFLSLNILIIVFLFVFLSLQQINKTKNISANVVAVVNTNSSTTNSSDSVKKEDSYFFSGGLTKDLFLNSKGDEVKLLQTWLVKDGSLTALPNGYFGPATQKAVKAYQTKNGIVILNKKSTTSLEYGKVGPITRASLNSQFGNKMEGVSWVSGKYGAGVLLDGGYVEIANNPNLDVTYQSGVMFDAWINPSILLKTKEIVFARSNHYGLGITDGGKIFVRQNGADIVTTKKYVKTGEWQHISGTFLDGKVIFKYNDTQVEVKKYKVKVVKPESDSLLVGVSFDSKKGYGEAYLGAIDNVYIYTVTNKNLAPLPKMRLILDDAQGIKTTSMTGIFHGELKVALSDKELLKTKIPETKVPELAPTIKQEESKFPPVVEKAIEVVQNVVHQFSGGGGGGGATPVVEQPAPPSWNGTPPDPNFPMPPHGQEAIYSASAGAGTTVSFSTVDINPLVVYPGDTQTLKVVVTSTAGTIISVQAVTQLDTSTKTLNLANDGTGTNTWTASWIVNDTHVNIYRTNFTATDSVGNLGTIPFAWSDPCSGLAASGTASLATACNVSAVEGVDNGNISISNGANLVLSSNATFVLTPGYSMTKSTGGYVTIQKGVGASMKKGYIFYAGTTSTNYVTSIVTKYFSTSSNYGGNTSYVRVVNKAGLYCDSGGIAPGITRTRYNVTTPCSGSTACASEVQTCQTSGSWNGSYASTSCTASTRAGFTTSSPSPCGTACSAVAQTQTCQPNGTWNGSGITSCAVVSCCVPTYNNVCYSSANACGDSTQGTILCGGGCSVTTAPACDCQTSCERWNSCGTDYASGWTNTCGAGCSATTPPNPGASPCDGPANACGDSNTGSTDVCGNGCSATTAPACNCATSCDRCNSCGGCNSGSTNACGAGCDVSAPPNPGVSSCDGPANACGDYNTGSTDVCGNGCSATTAPGYNYGTGACSTACGSGTTDRCTGSCDGAPPEYGEVSCMDAGCAGTTNNCTGACVRDDPYCYDN